MSKSVLLSLGYIIVAMLSLQSGSSLAKTLLPTIGPLGVSSLRILFGALVLLLFLRPWQHKKQFTINRNSLLALLAYASCLACMNLLFYRALLTLPLGIAVGLEFLGPLTVALLSSRQRVDFLWILLASVGLFILLPFDQSLTRVDPFGVCFALAAGGFWAIYIIVGKKVGQSFGTPAVALGASIASLLVVPAGISQIGMTLFSLQFLPPAFAMAILTIAVPFTLEMIALTRLPTKTFSTLMSLEPAIAALCGFLFLGEHLTWSEWAALIAIMIASIGAALNFKTKIKLTATNKHSP